jgi:hypothetical protein
MEWVSRNAPYGTVVDFQDATPGTCDMLRWDGLMRYDLKCASRIGNPELLLFDVEERFSEEEIRLWPRMDTVGPVYEAAVDGVPMVRVYQKHAGCETVLNQHALSLPSPTGGGDFHAGGREPRGEGGWDAQGGDVEAGEGDIMEHDAEELEP